MVKGSGMINKLPVILITGFLGAGKTTFLNEMLLYLKSLDKSVALLINEFGKINIDKNLVDPNPGTIFEVNQGSIFCVCTRDQFLKALDEIASHSPSFDAVVIESTGIANTRDIGEYLDTPQLKDKIDIKQNFCLVDAVNFHKVFATLPAVKIQIEEASVCIINKSDLVESENITELGQKLKNLNPDAELIITKFGKIDFSHTLDFSKSWAAGSALDTVPPQNINSITVAEPGIFDKNKIQRFLNAYSENLLRAKGFIITNQGSIYIDWVGSSLFTRPYRKETDLISRLVLIGYRLDEENIKNEFKGCLVSS